jgi:cob(I)alamin adenosyltransferase
MNKFRKSSSGTNPITETDAVSGSFIHNNMNSGSDLVPGSNSSLDEFRPREARSNQTQQSWIQKNQGTTERKNSVDQLLSCVLPNGEVLSKQDKLFAATGAIEELRAYIGIIKARHYNPGTGISDLTSRPTQRSLVDKGGDNTLKISEKMFLFARLTQIQENLQEIITSLLTSKKDSTKYEKTRFDPQGRLVEELKRELKRELTSRSEVEINPRTNLVSPANHIPGSTELEAQLYYCKCICQRCERQVLASKNLSLGLVPDRSISEYLYVLGQYLLNLAQASL